MGLCAVGVVSCASRELRQVRRMPIAEVDPAGVPDGTRPGAFDYGPFTAAVEVTVRDGQIVSLTIVKNNPTSCARRAAEGVLRQVLERQTPNVDAVTGATTTSKALMKAVELALTGEREREQE